MLTVWQTQPNGAAPLLVCHCTSQQEAQDETDRINSHLADAGVPGWVSSAYWSGSDDP